MCAVASIDDLVNDLNLLQLRRVAFEATPVCKNPQILLDLLDTPEAKLPQEWTPIDRNNPSHRLVRLDENSTEYLIVKNKFSLTMRKNYKVDYIDRVENPYLYAQYKLKQMQKREQYGTCMEKEYFHGTSLSNVVPICSNNFNWRLTGTSLGHRFGQGISFSPSSTYSCHYPRNNYSTQRIMFLCNVLVSSSCLGDSMMKIPPISYDTSCKSDGQVIVKYEDNDFYPQYVIYYSNRFSSLFLL